MMNDNNSLRHMTEACNRMILLYSSLNAAGDSLERYADIVLSEEHRMS